MWYIIWIFSLCPADLHSVKLGLINWFPLRRVNRCFISIKPPYLVSQLNLVSQTLSVRFSKLVSQTFWASQLDFCQALSISQSLNLSLSLRDIDRADTIITFHPPTTTTENFLSTYRWLIVKCYTSLKSSAQALLFPLRKNRVN